MKRKGLRHVLPVVFTIVYVVLVYVGDRQDHSTSRSAHNSQAVPEPDDLNSETVEGVGWDPDPHGPPASVQCAIGMNLPAVIAALPAILLAEKFSPERETSEHVGYLVGGLFVPALWFLVGRWFDRRLGLLPPIVRRRQNLGVELVALVLLLIVDCFLFFALLTGEIYHGIFTVVALAGWISFAALCLYHRVRTRTAV